MAQEKFFFQSEAAELLTLMIHSVYSNREIFLREVISNASDALDKRRIEVLSHSDEYGEYRPRIRIVRDRDNRTLSIEDNGIGMSREEIVEYIGTIAKSGTREFLASIKDAKNDSLSTQEMLIGQFGVGFYSTFMVADRVELISRRLGTHEAWRFESAGDGSYTLEETTLPECGTVVRLHLREPEEGESDYLDEWTIRDLIRKYSDFIAWPIVMDCTKWDDGKETVAEETLNSQKAIWCRPEEDVAEEEYREFYRHLSRDWQEPLARVIINAEGSVSFRGLLFVPQQAPFDLFADRNGGGISLYIKRVFIMNDCKDLIPEYLRFVRGVIDSEDLPLNISREILQEDGRVRIIRRSILRKIFSTLRKMLENEREKYEKFWNAFGRIFKEGALQDQENAETIMQLSLFASGGREGWTTLDDCIERMKPDQEGIYWLFGRDMNTLKDSPKLESFAEKGYEVLLLTDPVDEMVMSRHPEYREKKFLNVGSASVQVGTEEERKEVGEKLKGLEEAFGPLKKCFLDAFPEALSDARLSARMTSSPVCLAAEGDTVSLQMEQLMRAMGHQVPPAKRVLELNPDHPVIRRLMTLAASGDGGADERVRDSVSVLYDQALLLDGGILSDPGQFSRKLSALMALALEEPERQE